MLTANDCRNAVALINRATIQGSEVEEVARLKLSLLEHAKLVEADQEQKTDQAHKPTAAELRDLENSFNQ